jgi:hypothetical protein
MRRYTFYLSVALLAFGIGSFVVFKFYFKNAEQPVITQAIEKNKLEIKEKFPTSIQKISEDDEINDEEKAAFDVLKPTIKKWLRGEKIKNERNEISFELIKEITGKSESQLDENERHFWQDSGFEFTPSLIDVDRDGKNELAIRNYCAPVGNCQFWIFKKKGDGYEILLKAINDVQMFKLRKSKTKKYFDLETTAHGDAWSGGMSVYKFDGKEYILEECFDYTYIYIDKKGRRHELKKPILTPLHCC